jgi:chemotaxis protein methyltransferase CheR
LARAYANLGKLDNAVQWCRKAITTDKLNPGYHYLLVTISQEQGNQAAAVQSLKKCLYIDPNFILAHFTLGNILGRQKDFKGSHRHLSIALSLLESHGDEDIVFLEEGLTAGRLREIIKTTLEMRKGPFNDR